MQYRTSQYLIEFHMQIILVDHQLPERKAKIVLIPYIFHKIIIFFIHTFPLEVKSVSNIKFILNLT